MPPDTESPNVLAPLSEVYGRNPIYLSAVLLFTLLYIPQALAKNITTIIVVRWFQGMAASVGNSMVAGSVSDVFHASERGFPMSLYAIAVYIAQGVSPYISRTFAGSLLTSKASLAALCMRYAVSIDLICASKAESCSRFAAWIPLSR